MGSLYIVTTTTPRSWSVNVSIAKKNYGREFWNDAEYIGAVGERVNVNIIQRYIYNRRRTTEQLKSNDF